MKRNPMACVLVPLLLAACDGAGDRTAPASAREPATPPIRLDSDRARVSYMVGLDVARDLQPIRDELDLAVVEQATRSALAGEKPRLDAAEIDAVRRGFTAHLRQKRAAALAALAQKNRREGEAFLAANAREPGVVTTASGLQYRVLRPGKGPTPARDGTVSVHYRARLLDGREFANSYTVQHPETLPLARVMPGLAEGVGLMTPGSRYRLWIPAKLAYGEAGKPGEVEPNATLVFDIELLEVADESPMP